MWVRKSNFCAISLRNKFFFRQRIESETARDRGEYFPPTKKTSAGCSPVPRGFTHAAGVCDKQIAKFTFSENFKKKVRRLITTRYDNF